MLNLPSRPSPTSHASHASLPNIFSPPPLMYQVAPGLINASTNSTPNSPHRPGCCSPHTGKCISRSGPRSQPRSRFGDRSSIRSLSYGLVFFVLACVLLANEDVVKTGNDLSGDSERWERRGEEKGMDVCGGRTIFGPEKRVSFTVRGA